MKATLGWWGGGGREGVGGGIPWPSCRQLGCRRHAANGSTLSSSLCPSYHSGLEGTVLIRAKRRGRDVAQTVPVQVPLAFHAFVCGAAQTSPVGVQRSLRTESVSVPHMHLFENIPVFISLP